jgi:PhoPQ-activated pathogenicity-related protein
MLALFLFAAFGQGTTLLDQYISSKDDSFKWNLESVKDIPLAGKIHHLRLTSQTWQGIAWEHDLILLEPSGTAGSETIMMLNTGGKPGAGNQALALAIAAKLKAPLAVLYQIPNQPIYGKTEDGLIAETFSRFIDGGGKDGSLPLLFPMAKSVMRGMDALEAHTAKAWPKPAKKYVLTGASKRGWTTWLTGAVDKRIVAIAPMVIDTLNMLDQFEHQLKSFGKPSEQIRDYTERKLVPLPAGEAPRRLWAGVDPYLYRDRYQLPKLILNGSNDPYWTVDALNLYWDGLPGRKHVLIVPNAGHNLDEKSEAMPRKIDRALASLSAFGRAAIRGASLPEFSWAYTGSPRETRLSMSGPARRLELWFAEAPTKDFRQARWNRQEIAIEESDPPKAQVALKVPENGYRAYYGMGEFIDSGEPYWLSTQVRVIGAD